MATVAEKMKALGAQRIGGKGTPRRKVKKAHKPAVADDKKLGGALKKLNPQNLGPVDEVNMFKADGNVIHFTQPKVQAAVGSNTFVIAGAGETKQLTELVPGILNQLGPESLTSLRKLAETYQSAAKAQGAENAGAVPAADDDDDVPELTENFDEAK